MNIRAAIEQWDHNTLQLIQMNIGPLLTMAMLAITFLGNPVFWVGIAAALYWSGQENRGFFLMNLVMFTAAVVGGIKHLAARPRPSPCDYQVLGADKYVEPSFPSGHSAMIGAAFAYGQRRVKGYKKLILVIAVALVAYSRLYLGMHFPSDVLFGILIGLLIGKANMIARDKLFHRNFKPTKLEDEIALVALIAAGVLSVMFFRSVPMAGLFIGFYAGFFIFKEKGLSQSILLRKPLATKYAGGFAPLLFMILIGESLAPCSIALNDAGRFIAYTVGGLWISLIWPILFERFFRAVGARKPAGKKRRARKQ